MSTAFRLGKRPARPQAPIPRKPPPAAAEDAPAKVEEAERYCPYCGFTFRGKVKARCPECAAPMDSPTDLYQFADVGWVRRSVLGLVPVARIWPADPDA